MLTNFNKLAIKCTSSSLGGTIPSPLSAKSLRLISNCSTSVVNADVKDICIPKLGDPEILRSMSELVSSCDGKFLPPFNLNLIPSTDLRVTVYNLLQADFPDFAKDNRLKHLTSTITSKENLHRWVIGLDLWKAIGLKTPTNIENSAVYFNCYLNALERDQSLEAGSIRKWIRQLLLVFEKETIETALGVLPSNKQLVGIRPEFEKRLKKIPSNGTLWRRCHSQPDSIINDIFPCAEADFFLVSGGPGVSVKLTVSNKLVMQSAPCDDIKGAMTDAVLKMFLLNSKDLLNIFSQKDDYSEEELISLDELFGRIRNGKKFKKYIQLRTLPPETVHEGKLIKPADDYKEKIKEVVSVFNPLPCLVEFHPSLSDSFEIQLYIEGVCILKSSFQGKVKDTQEAYKQIIHALLSCSRSDLDILKSVKWHVAIDDRFLDKMYKTVVRNKKKWTSQLGKPSELFVNWLKPEGATTKVHNSCSSAKKQRLGESDNSVKPPHNPKKPIKLEKLVTKSYASGQCFYSGEIEGLNGRIPEIVLNPWMDAKDRGESIIAKHLGDPNVLRTLKGRRRLTPTERANIIRDIAREHLDINMGPRIAVTRKTHPYLYKR